MQIQTKWFAGVKQNINVLEITLKIVAVRKQGED